MDYKYALGLESLKKWFIDFQKGEIDKEYNPFIVLNDLQELIDNYSKLEKKLVIKDKALDSMSKTISKQSDPCFGLTAEGVKQYELELARKEMKIYDE